MTLLPRSLFGRLVLLLVAVVALAVLVSVVTFGAERSAVLKRQFGETRLVQLQALRAALAGADGPQRRETLERLSGEYGVRIIPESERPMRGQPPAGPLMQEMAEGRISRFEPLQPQDAQVFDLQGGGFEVHAESGRPERAPLTRPAATLSPSDGERAVCSCGQTDNTP